MELPHPSGTEIIMDRDFMRLNKLASTEERKFLFSLMVLSGSALAIADQYDTAPEDAGQIYGNEELLAIHDAGFNAKPLSCDIHDINSSRWVGQLPDGDYVVGLFNREDSPMEYGVDFFSELGIGSGRASNVRDLWEHRDLGAMSDSYSAVLPPHSCVVLRITPDGNRRYQAECATLTDGACVRYGKN